MDNSKLKVGMTVRVNLPDNAHLPEDPATVVGKVRAINVPCPFSGLKGTEVVHKDGMVYHVNPAWIEDAPLDDASAEM